jgi:hypothetical protein
MSNSALRAPRSALDAPYFVIMSDHRHLPERHWYPCLVVSDATEHEALERAAERICGEFGGVVTETYGAAEGEKEYWWITVEGRSLLLMRKMGLALLGDGREDIQLVERIGVAFQARSVGWRWRLWKALRHLPYRR